MRIPQQNNSIVRDVGNFEVVNHAEKVSVSKAWWQPQNYSTGGKRSKCNLAFAACESACVASTAGFGLVACTAACGTIYNDCIS
jgi:hypothetical protein